MRRPRWRGDHDGGVGWATVVTSLAVMGPLGSEIAHLPLDHPGVAAVPPLAIDLADHLIKKALVVIIMTDEGEKNPVSISWTG